MLASVWKEEQLAERQVETQWQVELVKRLSTLFVRARSFALARSR